MTQTPKCNFTWEEVTKGNGIRFRLHFKSLNIREKISFTLIFSNTDIERVPERIESFITGKVNVCRISNSGHIKIIRVNKTFIFTCSSGFIKSEKCFDEVFSKDLILWLKHLCRVIKRHKVLE